MKLLRLECHIPMNEWALSTQEMDRFSRVNENNFSIMNQEEDQKNHKPFDMPFTSNPTDLCKNKTKSCIWSKKQKVKANSITNWNTKKIKKKIFLITNLTICLSPEIQPIYVKKNNEILYMKKQKVKANSIANWITKLSMWIKKISEASCVKESWFKKMNTF